MARVVQIAFRMQHFPQGTSIPSPRKYLRNFHTLEAQSGSKQGCQARALKGRRKATGQLQGVDQGNGRQVWQGLPLSWGGVAGVDRWVEGCTGAKGFGLFQMMEAEAGPPEASPTRCRRQPKVSVRGALHLESTEAYLCKGPLNQTRRCVCGFYGHHQSEPHRRVLPKPCSSESSSKPPSFRKTAEELPRIGASYQIEALCHARIPLRTKAPTV